MRPFLLACLGGLPVLDLALADDSRGAGAGKAVAEQYRDPSAVEAKIFQPLSTTRQMQTLDGRAFDAGLDCPAQQEFLRISIVPSENDDLQSISTEVDRDLDGTREAITTLPGPFAAVCTNGAVICDAGTTDHCQGRAWRTAQGQLIAAPVPYQGLGGCYCFNHSCGPGLLDINTQQVLGDLGSGIAAALQQEDPRLAIGSALPVDATTMRFFAQQAGCGAGPRPEIFASHPEELRAAGVAAGADPSSQYSRLAHSDVAQQKGLTEKRCEAHRRIQLENVDASADVLGFQGGTNLTTTSCGARCINLQLGRTGNNYLDANCGSFADQASWLVHRPDLIESAVLTFAHYDDYFSVVFDGDHVVWSDPAGWDGTVPHCSENDDRGDKTPNVDVTALLRAKPSESIWTWRNTTWWNDKGEGWAILRLRFAEDCVIGEESVDDACVALDANVDCARRDETVDGVPTWSHYLSTGRTPLPAAREVATGSCQKSLVRDFWNRERLYTCTGAARPFDATLATDRYRVVSSTFNPTSGHFDDVRTAPDGTRTLASSTIPLPPPQTPACQTMCRTRRPRAGQSMGNGGSVGQLNPAPPAWDYTYRDCDVDFHCPAGPGEEIVSACNCDSNFTQAVSILQTIRMAAQDQQCHAP